MALLGKEFVDMRQHLTLFLPALLVGLLSMLIPLMVAVVVPYVTGERLSDSSDFDIALEMYKKQPQLRSLDPEGAIQAFIFQYFLVIFSLVPVTVAMSVAAHAIIGEKQARALEPLLVTPITTFELLGAKVLASLLPAIVITAGTLLLYMIVVATTARPGVFLVLVGPRSIALIFVLAPLAALAALQGAVCVSSRVNDPRTAQQVGALVILPIAGLFIAQIAGAIELTVRVTLWLAAALVVVNAILMGIGIRLFDRETILTRWT
jgi:ABC-2 type transport system permease protein